MCRFQFLPKVFMLFYYFCNGEILSHRFRKSQYEIMFFSSAASFGCSRDLTPFSLPFYLRRKRDCPFEQSLKRKRETNLLLISQAFLTLGLLYRVLSKIAIAVNERISQRSYFSKSPQEDFPCISLCFQVRLILDFLLYIFHLFLKCHSFKTKIQ